MTKIHFGGVELPSPTLGMDHGTRTFPVMADRKVRKMLVRAGSGKSAVIDNQRGTDLFMAFT